MQVALKTTANLKDCTWQRHKSIALKDTIVFSEILQSPKKKRAKAKRVKVTRKRRNASREEPKPTPSEIAVAAATLRERMVRTE